MISCKEVAKLLLRDELESQPRLRRVEIRLHLAMCRICSRLARQIRQMGESARKLAADNDEGKDFEERLLRRLKEN